jgi:hypothetical protein
MSEQEMLAEIDRLRRELAEATESRNRLRELVCAILPVDPPDVTEKLVLEMMQQPAQGIDDIIADLRRDEPPHGRQIPA